MSELKGKCPYGRVIFKKEAKKEEKTSFGIIIPDSDKGKFKGTVVLAGTPIKGWDKLNPGDVITYAKNRDIPFDIDGVDYFQVNYSDILYVKEANI